MAAGAAVSIGGGMHGGRTVGEGTTDGERTYATFQHLTLLTAGVFPLLAAIIMWRIRARESPFLDDHGRESVNFQISLLIYFVAGTILIPLIVGIPIIIGTIALGIVGMILGAMAGGRGEYFRYPATIRLLH
jgi:uncharacterized Tic20 family protein